MHQLLLHLIKILYQKTYINATSAERCTISGGSFKPKSVVTYYSNILKVMYSGNLSDKDVENIAAQLRGIFDDELLTLNPYDEYLKRLQDEIKDYKSAGRTIADYVIENNSNMEFLTYKGKDYAKIDVMYFVHESKNIIKNYEKFTLRKDDGGRWKILYWEVGKASDMEE